MRNLAPILIFTLLLAGCKPANYSENRMSELETTDATLQQISNNAAASGISFAFSIDHSRLAEETGEVLDASRVIFHTNNEINSQILSNQIRAGLDLPFRILAFYKQKDQRVIFTNADFIRIRHGLDNLQVLQAFDRDLAKLTAGVTMAQPVSTSDMSRDYGIVELESDFGFDESVMRLKETILAEGDTVWFYDIDFQKQAREFGIQLPEVSLLVFGAPAPGAKAMREYPSIGLDAFAQKVLVYREADRVKVIYNDIPDIAELHYGDSAIPHHVIAYRLKSTLSGAITRDD